jgi:2-hydroxycyclohexanecarboxyl-CoA dehydrogenase
MKGGVHGKGIRVNAVGPGPIFTPFYQRRVAASGETLEQYKARAAQGQGCTRHHSEAPGQAEEVAAAILF